MKKRTTAIGLFSGGLDSIIAAKLIQNQGIDIAVLIFKSPFFNYKENCFAIKAAEANKIPYKVIDLCINYLKIIKKPRYGHGKHMNPCIDCKILMLKIANLYMKKIKADFVFTGEVLDQRPKSQNKNALGIIAKESGLNDRLLRPLSAKILPITYPEKKSLINREKLLGIQGRQRAIQLELAKKFNITEFSTPSGGCLLTEHEYCQKLDDLLKNKKRPNIKDLLLLKLGRHFRFKKSKIIVGKNEKDNFEIKKLRQKSDLIFEPKVVMGPTTLLTGQKNKKSIKLAASLTARYSDDKKENVSVKYGREKLDKELFAKKITESELEKIRIK